MIDIVERKKRIEIANKFIKIISNYGRRFFYNKKKNEVAYLKLKNNKVYFVSEFTAKEIFLHYKYWKFGHGGTMRALINNLKEYIMHRRNLPISHLGPWPDYLCDGDLWGYSDDMEKVRQECKELVK